MDPMFVVIFSVPASVMTSVTVFICKAMPLLSDRVNARARRLAKAKRK